MLRENDLGESFTMSDKDCIEKLTYSKINQQNKYVKNNEVKNFKQSYK